MEKALAHIATLIGQENLFRDAGSLAAYGAIVNYGCANIQESPLAVARPRHPAQLARMLAFCASERIPLAILGSGTRPVERPPLAGKILLVTTGLDRIYEINAKTRSLHAQAGIACAALRAHLAAKNLFCPVEPFGTVGGALAVNPATCQALRYGSMSNFVAGLELAFTNGERLYTSLPNGAPGCLQSEIPLAGLVCGSMGKLAVITACHLRLLPAPAARILLAYEFDDLVAAASAAGLVMASALSPSRLELCDDICAQVLGLPAKPALVCEFEGSESDVAEAKAGCARILAGAFGSEPEAADFVALLPLLLKAKGRFELLRCACTPDRLRDLLLVIQKLAAEYNLDVAVHCDAAVARAQIAIFNAAKSANSGEFEKRLFASELMLNDALATEAEADLSRSQWQATHKDGMAVSLKALFDPHGILNSSQDSGQR